MKEYLFLSYKVYSDKLDLLLEPKYDPSRLEKYLSSRLLNRSSCNSEKKEEEMECYARH